ncbi:hypothetical protein TeGR_g950 [Tetraparma gracilis]|uniref:Haloacid dehalogenase-like hydrolase n=1 Tax=Tetraparma gracilis TaxID=2962635 RepID=A0ABQ6MKK9_9STRA|nr:hypothetical protein TeGR_g950 [Tetraparma gracilis]
MSPSNPALAIACDIDGTLIPKSTGKPDPASIAAILPLLTSPSPPTFFLATGKSRAGAVASLSPELPAKLLLAAPGVFLQGLRVYKGGEPNELLVDSRLPPDATELFLPLLAAHPGIALAAYDGDEIFADPGDLDHPGVRSLSEVYGEPSVLPLSLAKPRAFHKLLLLAPPDDPAAVAPLLPPLESLASELGLEVTSATPSMLEVLPARCSKAAGVRALLSHLNVPPSRTLAIGDERNDVEMLGLCFGVACKDAAEAAKQAADVVLERAAYEGGVAEAIRAYAGGKGGG